MVTLIRYIAAFAIGVICLLFSSCNLDIAYDSVKAEGEVTTKTRKISSFNKIKASQGLRVIISNGETGEIKVQANENLHDIIITEVKDNTLIIRADKNIRKADAKNIMVNIDNLYAIKSSSGSSIRSNDEIQTTKMDLDASSGSTINIDLEANAVSCSSSSGSSIVISGKSDNIVADSSSGSTINAIDHESKSCNATSSSGSTIRLNCDSSITAKASSGSSIKYDGSPTHKDVKKSSGASVKSI